LEGWNINLHDIFVSYNKVLVSRVSLLPKCILHLQSTSQFLLPISIFFRQIPSTKGAGDNVWLKVSETAQENAPKNYQLVCLSFIAS
jgi:hypothetical protein